MTLLSQISNSTTTTISGTAVLTGLMVSTITLIRFLVTRSTTDEGRSTQIWDDLRTELDEARLRADRATDALDGLRDLLRDEEMNRARWQNLAERVRTEYRIRLGEEPSSWPTQTE